MASQRKRKKPLFLSGVSKTVWLISDFLEFLIGLEIKDLNYFNIDGVQIFCNLPFFFYPVVFRILSNNKISELKNGSFSGLSLLERL